MSELIYSYSAMERVADYLQQEAKWIFPSLSVRT